MIFIHKLMDFIYFPTRSLSLLRLSHSHAHVQLQLIHGDTLHFPPTAIDEAKLRQIFGEFGEITNVNLPMDRETNRPRGFCFIDFKDRSAVEAAISKMDGSELAGRNIKVHEAQPRRINW